MLDAADADLAAWGPGVLRTSIRDSAVQVSALRSFLDGSMHKYVQVRSIEPWVLTAFVEPYVMPQ